MEIALLEALNWSGHGDLRVVGLMVVVGLLFLLGALVQRHLRSRRMPFN